MDPIPSTGGPAGTRGRRRLTNEIRESMRELGIRLAFLNRRVSERLDMRDIDLGCLDVIGRAGPMSPTTLARLSGLHPATLTGILDRLERGGWIVRERDPSDRRAVVVRALKERGAEIIGLYGGMNASLEQICSDYTEAELRVLSDFLRRTGEAGRDAAQRLHDGDDEGDGGDRG
jgi:DNA-binding MarR family transcriptional regulator